MRGPHVGLGGAVPGRCTGVIADLPSTEAQRPDIQSSYRVRRGYISHIHSLKVSNRRHGWRFRREEILVFCKVQRWQAKGECPALLALTKYMFLDHVRKFPGRNIRYIADDGRADRRTPCSPSEPDWRRRGDCGPEQ